MLFDGYRRMPLTEAVITIGRALSNDIILDDRRVSRQHAQLRRRYGQYVIYDLDSSGGTTVNERTIRETPLQPGDVIGLAGVKVRFDNIDAMQPTGETTGTTGATKQMPRPKRGAQG
jgi:pSer/pThr/pTyr-binding forkhead associated (FHA) protein